MVELVRGVMRKVDGNGASVKDLRNRELEVKVILFEDDTALIADTEEGFQKMVTVFGKECEQRSLRVNVEKSKVMICGGEEEETMLNVKLYGRKMEEVKNFRYLGVVLSGNGNMKNEVEHRVGEGTKVFGALEKVWKNRGMSRRVKTSLYESIVVPTVVYGCEGWYLKENEKRMIEVFEMKCLRAICGVRRIDKVRREELRRMSKCSCSIQERVDEGVLKWFGHVERMGEERLVKQIYVSEVEGTRRRGRPKRRWMDAVSELLIAKSYECRGRKDESIK